LFAACDVVCFVSLIYVAFTFYRPVKSPFRHWQKKTLYQQTLAGFVAAALCRPFFHAIALFHPALFCINFCFCGALEIAGQGLIGCLS